MTVLRLVGAAILGYLLFAVGSMQLVGLVMRGGAAAAIGALVGLAVIGAVVGYLTARIAGPKAAVAAAVAATLIGLATLANLVFGLGAEPVWYKLATLLVTIPIVLWVARRSSS